MAKTPRRRAREDAVEDPPFWPLLVGFLLFAALLSLLGILQERHFDSYISAVVIGGAIAPWTWAWKYLPEKAGKELARRWAALLATPRTSWVLGGLLVVIGASSLTLASLHVDAVEAPDSVVTLYRYEHPPGAPESARLVDSVKIDGLHPHSIIRVWNAFSRNRVWIVSSALERTDEFTRKPWTKLELVYPQHFRHKIVGASLLPTEEFLPADSTRPVRVIVTDARGDTLATHLLRDSRAMPALLVSFIKPPPPDSTTRQTWIGVLRAAVGDAVSEEDATGMANDWMNVRWLQTRRDLAAGESVRVTFLRSSGDVLGSSTISLSSSFSHVLVRRT